MTQAPAIQQQELVLREQHRENLCMQQKWMTAKVEVPLSECIMTFECSL